jgi:hypothetical protein
MMFAYSPLKIRVRIGYQHPLVCRKRRLIGGGPSDDTRKARTRCFNNKNHYQTLEHLFLFCILTSSRRHN